MVHPHPCGLLISTALLLLNVVHVTSIVGVVPHNDPPPQTFDNSSVQYSYIFKCNSTYPYIHNAMLEFLPDNVLAGAFQAGASEGSADQVNLFTRSHDGGLTWEVPRVITPLTTTGPQWTPILRYQPSTGTLLCFYVENQQIFVVASTDLGDTWSRPTSTRVTGSVYGASSTCWKVSSPQQSRSRLETTPQVNSPKEETSV